MKTQKYKTKEEWQTARLGKLTGSKLHGVIVKRGTGRKIGFYELIAERVALPRDGENPMDRGIRLESEAIARFAKETGKKVDPSLIIWSRDDNEAISVSPDGIIGKTEAVEVKCLSSARHLEAFLTQTIPDEYEYQTLQYFIVNDKLKTLHVAFYDPAIPSKDFFFLTINRESVKDKITETLQYEKDLLAEVERITNELTY